MRNTFLALLAALPLTAQPPGQTDLLRLTRDVRTAIQNDSLASASELAERLEGAVQQRQTAWLIRDANERVKEVLSWLPDDTESLFVNQEPFSIRPDVSIRLISAQPGQLYSLERLAALNEGAFYRALGGRTVRLVAAASRNIPKKLQGIPAEANSQDVVYFYFFTGPVELPPPDESLRRRPVWRATAKVDAGDPPQPRVKRRQRDDESWILQARPDLLLLASRRELLDGILERMDGESKGRALAPDLPEWSQVDNTASFWGIRHYSARSKPDPDEPGFEAARLPQPDGAAVGAVIRLDQAKGDLEIGYLSERPLEQRRPYDNLTNTFEVDRSDAGVWRLRSNIQKRGPWPMALAMTMLGFGYYQ